MSWYVLVPERARLTARVGAGCTVRARAAGAAGTVVEGVLAGDAALELAPLAGQAARPEPEAAGCKALAAPALVTSAALVVPGEPPRIERVPAPTNVIFLVLDFARFDRVHAFSPDAPVATPTLDRLAESSTLFLNHYVQGNESQVSHASMWTAMYLAKHRAARWEDSIPSRFFTLDELARRAARVHGGGHRQRLHPQVPRLRRGVEPLREPHRGRARPPRRRDP